MHFNDCIFLFSYGKPTIQYPCPPVLLATGYYPFPFPSALRNISTETIPVGIPGFEEAGINDGIIW